MTTALSHLNLRQQSFCESYARYGNASRAAREAGYSERSAHAHGTRLLRDGRILRGIAEVRSDRFRALHMEADEVLALVAQQARGQMQHIAHITPDGDPYLDPSKADPGVLQHIKKMTIEDFVDGREVDEEGNVIKREVRRVMYEIESPGDARKTLMKHLGLLTDKVEHSFDGDFAAKMAAAFARSNKGTDDGRD